MKTTVGVEMSDEVLCNYFSVLINHFFKILPLKEDQEPTLDEYMNSLLVELVGNQKLMTALNFDGLYPSLTGILKYLIDNDCSTPVVKREVFKAISICKKLQKKYQKEAE